MTTPKPLQLSLGFSISSPLGSPASRTQQRASVKRRKMTAICGPNSTESFARFSPDGLCLRTLGGYLVARLDGSFEEFSGTWPAQGLMQSGQLFQRQIWEPPTAETEYGLLPTPTASDIRNSQPSSTPVLTKNGTIRHQNKQGGQSFMRLSQVVKLLPTPTATDWRHGSPSHKNREGSPNLRDSMAEMAGASRLNPYFVEEMMGYPIGWTELEDSETP